MRIWVPYENDRERGFFHQHEDAEGKVLDMEGLVHHDGGTSAVTGVDHRFEYHPGTGGSPEAVRAHAGSRRQTDI